MNKAQLIRKIRGNKTGTAVAAPTLVTPPSIVSEEVGVYEVGLLLTAVPGVYTGNPILVGYQWKRDGVDIAGATASVRLLTSADLNANITVTETVQNISGTLSSTSSAVGPVAAGSDPGTPPPDLTNALAGVASDTITRRNAIVAEFDNTWPGYVNQTFATDTLVTTSAALVTQFNAVLRSLPLSGWHRIRLDSTQPSGFWTGADLRGASVGSPDNHVWTTGEWFNSPADRASAGGGIVIESSDSNNPVMFNGTITLRGIRGIHFRNVIMTKEATDTTNAARDACQMIVVTASATNRDASVVMFENCDIGTLWNPAFTTELKCGVGITQTSTQEQVFVKNCSFKGCQTAIKGSGTRFAKFEGNDFQKVIGDAMIWLHTSALVNANSAWDERVIWWTRLNTMRNMLDNATLSSEHTDFGQAGTSGDIGNYSILHEFDVAYAERETYTDARYVTYTSNPTNGATLTIAGVAFTYRTTASLSTDIQIGASLSATLSTARTVIEAYGIPNLSRVSPSSTQLQIHFTGGNLGTVTASVGTVGSALRVAGGTQFLYNDDLGSAYSMECVNICCIGTANDGIGGTLWNGTGVYDRCTIGRPGIQPNDATTVPDGFNYSYDFETYFSRARKSLLTSIVVNHIFRSCVVGQIVDNIASTVISTNVGTVTSTNSTLLVTNNVFVKWDKDADPSEQPDALMAGTFGTDAYGRVNYTFTDDGAETQAQFRARMYAQLMLENTTDRANIGATNPSTWV